MATSNGAKAESGFSGSSEQNQGDICRDFLRKVCNRGKNCKFLHPANAEKKLEFCHDYQNSQCRRRNCRFIHCKRDDEEYYLENGNLPDGVDEIQSRGSNSKGSKDVGEIPLCREFLNGRCSRGASCKYRHQSEGDLQYERMRRTGYGGGWEEGMSYDDYEEYGYDRARRPPPPGYSRGPMPRYGRMSFDGSSNYYDFEPRRPRSVTDLEDENNTLKRKIEILRKQVDDLTSTNEILLQQNAQLRTGKGDLNTQMQLAMMSQ